MKRRCIPALSIGIAVILIGSLAYAADRRKNAKNADQPADNVHEEEALKAELLDALELQEKKPRDSSAARRVVAIRAAENNTAEPAQVTRKK